MLLFGWSQIENFAFWCSRCEADDEYGNTEYGDGGRVITPQDIVDQFGSKGGLDEAALVEACPTLLNCQVWNIYVSQFVVHCF